ncbi:MAG: putative bifunctional diguanylate cyclase/phosphodiesterase, partial [Actinomycetota bacterium]
ALLRDADTAMYRAKMRGRSRCELFTEQMRASARDRALLSASLESALARGELSLVYQPILDAHTRRIVAAESLVRWHHRDLGLLTPSSFIDLAEDSGTIVPIGEWVIQQSCRDLRRWLDTGQVDRHFVVHINVSRRQVADRRFVERLTEAAESSAIPPSRLVLEFDEKMLLDDDGTILRTLLSLKRLGFRLSIDDFGTGYSSLSHLRSCPTDYLKLDGSFVRGLGQDERDDPIVRSMIQLAHSLDITVIAEWVTTSDQWDRLRLLGCDQVQGFGIGRPVRAEDLFGARVIASSDPSEEDR